MENMVILGKITERFSSHGKIMELRLDIGLKIQDLAILWN